jgi:nucleoside-triphosphatase THEP1
MVYIVSAEINEGKTQKLLAIYNELKQGDGFVSRKIFLNGEDFIGYEIVRLSTNEKMPLAYKSRYVPSDWDEVYRYGPFSFSKKAFAFAGRIIDDTTIYNIEPVFIDEIGPLELEGKGFAALLEKVLKTQKDVYITVRNHCARDVIKEFNIQNHKTIKVN